MQKQTKLTESPRRLLSNQMPLTEREKALADMLHSVRWSANGHCPCCFSWQGNGHLSMCELAEMLSDLGYNTEAENI